MEESKKKGAIKKKNETEEYDPKRRMTLYTPDSIRSELKELGQKHEEELTPNMMALAIVSEVIKKKIPLEALTQKKDSLNY
ncbi:hypothetical protein [Clostridium saccharoperbutylacetonicum]|uniref:hypothetical protein n=1 Tax=Clostridium saccharoperbutylacetonicum TaxID=36745 RepID=UPI0039E99FDF